MPVNPKARTLLKGTTAVNPSHPHKTCFAFWVCGGGRRQGSNITPIRLACMFSGSELDRKQKPVCFQSPAGISCCHTFFTNHRSRAGTTPTEQQVGYTCIASVSSPHYYPLHKLLLDGGSTQGLHCWCIRGGP